MSDLTDATALPPPKRRRLKPVEQFAEVLPGPSDHIVVHSDETPPPPAQSLAEQEAEQVALAQSSPLALTFQLVSCAFASLSYEDDKVIPTYAFHPPCVRGYARPCQECRTCAHVRLMPVGERESFRHRYHGHGMVIPVSEEQADTIFEAATQAGAAPLANPPWAAYFKQLAEEAQRRREDEERVREMEAHQRGDFARRSTQG